MRSSIASSGVFTSPNYPGLYPRSVECHYIFSGKDRERVDITFVKYEIEGMAEGCLESTMSDYIEFSNFNVELTDRKMQRLCGSGTDYKVQSDSSFFRITFRSNNMYDATGFNATYQFGPSEEDNVLPDKLNAQEDNLGTCRTPPSTVMSLLLVVVKLLTSL
jgi:hypothetical protein